MVIRDAGARMKGMVRRPRIDPGDAGKGEVVVKAAARG